MNSPWLLCGIGILFCFGGAYLFYRNVFEEDRNMLKPILIMIAGVILIGLGTAKYFHLIN
jgi:uncharacterized membrane protein AbrB (regulator of aidB expression)